MNVLNATESFTLKSFILFYFIFCFLGLYLWHIEVPRLGVK